MGQEARKKAGKGKGNGFSLQQGALIWPQGLNSLLAFLVLYRVLQQIFLHWLTVGLAESPGVGGSKPYCGQRPKGETGCKSFHLASPEWPQFRFQSTLSSISSKSPALTCPRWLSHLPPFLRMTG